MVRSTVARYAASGRLAAAASRLCLSFHSSRPLRRADSPFQVKRFDGAHVAVNDNFAVVGTKGLKVASVAMWGNSLGTDSVWVRRRPFVLPASR